MIIRPDLLVRYSFKKKHHSMAYVALHSWIRELYWKRVRDMPISGSVHHASQNKITSFWHAVFSAGSDPDAGSVLGDLDILC
jgi:tRNA U54 and U55 pseudouridine synthase Pus10